MKNGDIFYTFDRETRLVKRMVCTEDNIAKSFVRSIEITGTTTFSHIQVQKTHIFPTAKQAFDALKIVMKHDYENRVNAAQEEFKRMYKAEGKHCIDCGFYRMGIKNMVCFAEADPSHKEPEEDACVNYIDKHEYGNRPCKNAKTAKT